MTINDFTRLIDAKPSGRNEWKACCPAHDDNRESLSVSIGRNGAIMLKCHRGCSNREIVDRLGLTFADLYPDKIRPNGVTYTPPKSNRQSATNKNRSSEMFDFHDVVATYTYRNGTRKLRDSHKRFFWQHLDGDEWKPRRGNAPHVLYVAGQPQDTLFIIEGEKDANQMARLGFYAMSPENGAGGQGKWLESYNQDIKGKTVRVIPDNDDVGRAFANEIATKIHSVAKSVQVLDLRTLWTDIKEHQDVSDMVEAIGEKETIKRIMSAETTNKHTTTKQSIATRLSELHPETNKRYRQTDLGAGNLFADIYRDVARYCPQAKAWYTYNGKVWEADSSNNCSTMQLCKTLADALLEYATTLKDDGDYSKYAIKWQTYKTRETILKDAQSVYPINMDEFDADPYLFNCQNCVINLKTRETTDHNPDLLLSKISNVVYDPQADCTEFKNFIDEIMCHDAYKVDYFKRIFGYALTGENSQEECYMCYGSTTRNGKSTLLDVIGYMFGDYAMNSEPETVAQRDRNTRGASGDLARLDGCRFLHMSEPKKDMMFDVGLLKKLLGRDTITARHMYAREFEFIPIFKLFINTNFLPIVGDDTLFSSERVKVITFDRHFEPHEQDIHLRKRLQSKSSISGIFNWCLEGLASYQLDDETLIVPDSVLSATNEYRQKSNKIQNFIDECLIEDIDEIVSVKDCYTAFQHWCKNNGCGCDNKTNWLSSMKSKVDVASSGTINGKTVRNVIKGYSFTYEMQCEIYGYPIGKPATK